MMVIYQNNIKKNDRAQGGRHKTYFPKGLIQISTVSAQGPLLQSSNKIISLTIDIS